MWHRKMSSKQAAQVSGRCYFKEAVTPRNANTAGAFFLFEIKSLSIIFYSVNKSWATSSLMSSRGHVSVFSDVDS